MDAINTLTQDQAWCHCRIFYGKDRCYSSGKSYFAMSSPCVPQPTLAEDEDVELTMIPNRTIYLGGIHADATVKDLCDVYPF